MIFSSEDPLGEELASSQGSCSVLLGCQRGNIHHAQNRSRGQPLRPAWSKESPAVTCCLAAEAHGERVPELGTDFAHGGASRNIGITFSSTAVPHGVSSSSSPYLGTMPQGQASTPAEAATAEGSCTAAPTSAWSYSWARMGSAPARPQIAATGTASPKGVKV